MMHPFTFCYAFGFWLLSFRTIDPDRRTVCFCVWHLCICISPPTSYSLPQKKTSTCILFLPLTFFPHTLSPFIFFFLFFIHHFCFTTMQSHHDSCDNSSSPVVVAQHLDVEQKNYEFPPRALLLELSAHLDKDSYYEMFDESSFATTTITGSSVDRLPSYDDIGSDDDERLDSYIGSIVSSYQQQQQQSRSIRRSLAISYDDDHRERNHLSCFNHDHHHENDNDDPRVQRLIEDDRLSPLLLPARADPRRTCQTSYDKPKISSTTPSQQDLVAPSSFLKYHGNATAAASPYQQSHKGNCLLIWSFPTPNPSPLLVFPPPKSISKYTCMADRECYM